MMNRVKYIFAVLTFFMCMQCYSQVSTIYTVEDIGNRVDCFVNLYSDNKFELCLDCFEGENVTQTILSVGKYHILKNVLHLNDLRSGFDMAYRIDDDKLIPIKTFDFLASRMFKKYYLDTRSEKFKYDLTPKDKSNISLFEKMTDGQKIGLGKYIVGVDNNIVLNVYAEKFDIKYMNLTLMSGSYAQKGNVIKLYDSSLSSFFYIFIYDGKLLPSFFPYNYGQLIKID